MQRHAGQTLENCGDEFVAGPWRSGELRAPSAAQVQARTQQQAAEKGQSEHLLEVAHGSESSSTFASIARTSRAPERKNEARSIFPFELTTNLSSNPWTMELHARMACVDSRRELLRHLFG